MSTVRRIAVISAHTSPLAKLGWHETGGMNVYVRELSREMGARGYLIDIFTRRADAASPDVVHSSENVRVIHLRVGPEGSAGKSDLHRHLGDLERELVSFQQAEEIEYDLIHSHYWLSGWVGLSLRERWHVPLVAMFHTLGEAKKRVPVAEHEPPCRIEGERQVAQRADRIICASDHERRLLEDVYGADPRRISVVACGVDLGLFKPIDKEAARDALGLNGKKMVLFVGRIEPLKGVDILLAAAAQMRGESDFQIFVVGGDGTATDEMRRLRGLASDLGIIRRVSFLGPVDHDRLPLFYNAADICVVPSYYESFGLVALEAMACGTPVVASRVGGLTVTVRDGETGYLIPWHYPQPFAERMALLLGDEELRRSFGRTAREAVKGFGWSSIADALESLYRELLGKSEAKVASRLCC